MDDNETQKTILPPDDHEPPEWWRTSLYAAELAALGTAGRKFLLDLCRQVTNVEEVLVLAIATARMADRLALLNAGLAAGGIGYGTRPSKLLAEIARVEKLFLANLRGLGYCDRPEKDKEGKLF